MSLLRTQPTRNESVLNIKTPVLKYECLVVGDIIYSTEICILVYGVYIRNQSTGFRTLVS